MARNVSTCSVHRATAGRDRGTAWSCSAASAPPPSYHDERLRNAPVGYFFDVMTHGFGAMPDYATQVPVADRWAIAAYIRALQFSQRATVDDVPADRRAELDQPAAGVQDAPGGAQAEPATPQAEPAAPQEGR